MGKFLQAYLLAQHLEKRSVLSVHMMLMMAVCFGVSIQLLSRENLEGIAGVEWMTYFELAQTPG